MKGINKLESIVKGIWTVVSNPKEYAGEIYFGLLLGGAAISLTIASGQGLYEFVHRDQIARKHGSEVAIEVGYNRPEYVHRAAHFDLPYDQEPKQCGEGFILDLEDGTQLRYEVVCSYGLKETQLGDY